MSRIPAPTATTVADVVAGRHDEGTVVTFTGIANCFDWRDTKEGERWAMFMLLAAPTAVDAFLFPAAYAEFGDGMGPTLTDYRPQTVTVIATVQNGIEYRPIVIVSDVRRHTEEPCESLESMRRQSERFDAMLRRERGQEVFEVLHPVREYLTRQAKADPASESESALRRVHAALAAVPDTLRDTGTVS